MILERLYTTLVRARCTSLLRLSLQRLQHLWWGFLHLCQGLGSRISTAPQVEVRTGTWQTACTTTPLPELETAR